MVYRGIKLFLVLETIWFLHHTKPLSQPTFKELIFFRKSKNLKSQHTNQEESLIVKKNKYKPQPQQHVNTIQVPIIKTRVHSEKK